MNSFFWFIVLLIGTILIIIVSIFAISLLWKSGKGEDFTSTFLETFSNYKISIKDLIQTVVSIIAIFLASYAITKDSIRDKESSIRFSETSKTEKLQHKEIIKVYNEQKELLVKYKESSDLMLKQLKIQAKVAKLQFENQKILTQPGVNINSQAQDVKNTYLKFEEEEWLMPEVILQLHNFGSRIAKNVKTEIKFISPNSKTIHQMNQSTEPFLYPKAQMLKWYFPVINIKDNNFFMFVTYLEWTDEFNSNKKFKQTLYSKCLRENNGTYTIGTATGEYLKLIEEILENPSKTINNSEIIRKYMYDTFNK
ncbi:hypothetical protein MC378_06690 [Polaribacter sp. MSW13]|uniref:Uncharacterized protein n=1 Tax=Polaribacter marinus TaxID=2916838 RepID=A0A9X1VQI9_9FLAO|nr:hypothetical protein [Polaribacter marinus]MCI2228850.1 hypothetical protein [Polaribacter marinus]